MPELQLKVVKNTGDGIWGKALNNFNKVLYSSGGGLFNILINSKRNSLLRASSNYEEITKISNEKKRNSVTEKYEKAYDNYLNVLEQNLNKNQKEEDTFDMLEALKPKEDLMDIMKSFNLDD